MLVKPEGPRLAEHLRAPCHQAARQALVPVVPGRPNSPSGALGDRRIQNFCVLQVIKQRVDGRVNEARVLEDERGEGQSKSAAGGLVLVALRLCSRLGSNSGLGSAPGGEADDVRSSHRHIKCHVLVVEEAVDHQVCFAADGADGDVVAGADTVT